MTTKKDGFLISIDKFQKEELEEARKAIVSTIGKCEKILPKLRENSAQRTLLERRIKALRLSIELIDRELSNIPSGI